MTTTDENSPPGSSANRDANANLCRAGRAAASAEGELLAALRRRDKEALAALVRRYGPMLTRTAWLYLGDAHAAEDAAQETLIAAWDSAGRTNPVTPLEPWLLGILLNRCRKFIRTVVRRRRREKQAARQEVFQNAPGDQEEKLRSLRICLASLKPEHQELILLRYYRNFSVEETAEALGLPSGTVKSRCFAALGELRRRMETNHEPG